MNRLIKSLFLEDSSRCDTLSGRYAAKHILFLETSSEVGGVEGKIDKNEKSE